MNLHRNQQYYLKLLIVLPLLLVCGGLSMYLYYQLNKSGGEFIPGFLYTGATILMFRMAGIKIEKYTLLRYAFFMVLTYIAVWTATLFSSWFVWVCGPVTAGFGAVCTFMLTDKFIIQIPRQQTYEFLTGALAFVLTDILYLVFDNTPLETFFGIQPDPGVLYLELFPLWHLLVGLKLFFALSKK